MAHNITRDGTDIDLHVPEYNLELCDFCGMEFPEPNAKEYNGGVFCSSNCVAWEMDYER